MDRWKIRLAVPANRPTNCPIPSCYNGHDDAAERLVIASEWSPAPTPTVRRIVMVGDAASGMPTTPYEVPNGSIGAVTNDPERRQSEPDPKP